MQISKSHTFSGRYNSIKEIKSQSFILYAKYKFYIVFLEILRSIPTLTIVIIKLEPPYERKGRVTPVTGIKPTTTIKLRRAWKAKPNVIPKAKNLPNLSSVLIAILNSDVSAAVTYIQK